MTRRVLGVVFGVTLALLVLRLPPARSAAGGVDALVSDDGGRPLADAVVSRVPMGGEAPAPRAPAATMDQVNKEFVPAVLPVVVGTPVNFPNRDNIRHHVYSFSAAKKFELPLYMGKPASPIVFDKPGTVTLGCNIPDWMVGYVYVVATPWFAKTGADGRARVGEVPPDTYEARVWHPRMRLEPEKTGKQVTVAAGEPGQVAFALALKPERRVPRREYGTPQS